MTIEREAAIAQIDALIQRRQSRLANLSSDKFAEMTTLVCATIQRLAPPNSAYISMMEDALNNTECLVGEPQGQSVEGRLWGVLNALRSDFESGLIQTTAQGSDIPAFLQLQRILTRFHAIAMQLRKRRRNKDVFWVSDEYDVQDLLYALLRIDFDDIRPEEWTPSHAGQCSRMDFLLKKPKIVVEAKMTRDNLADKQLGDELLVDIARYKVHPECRTLICFIYDPDQRIANPAGLTNDLELESSDQLTVKVIITQH